MKQNDELYRKNESVTISIERINGKLILKNDKGNKWIFPENVGEYSAIATLVYSTLLHQKEYIESFADNFTIKMEIQELVT